MQGDVSKIVIYKICQAVSPIRNLEGQTIWN